MIEHMKAYDKLVLHLYTIMLLHLKLIGYIECSYWFVFAPLWVPTAFLVAIGAYEHVFKKQAKPKGC